MAPSPLPQPAADATDRDDERNAVEQLLDLILDSGLNPGDRLPAERALVDRLGIPRSAVREAIRTLEFLGLVQSVGGSGTYLRGGIGDLLPSTLNWGMMLARGQTADLHKVRAVLEVAAVETASSRYSQDGLDELAAIVDRQRQCLGDPAGYVEADSAFHRHIATTAGNSILADLLVTTRSLLRVWVERSVHKEQDMRDALREHAMIVRALRNGEAANAAAAMRLHMMTAEARILTAVDEPGR